MQLANKVIWVGARQSFGLLRIAEYRFESVGLDKETQRRPRKTNWVDALN